MSANVVVKNSTKATQSITFTSSGSAKVTSIKAGKSITSKQIAGAQGDGESDPQINVVLNPNTMQDAEAMIIARGVVPGCIK